MKKDLRSRDMIKMFDITSQTLYNWRKEGMPYSGSGKLLLYDEAEVRKWLNNRNSAEKVKVKEIIKNVYPDD